MTNLFTETIQALKSNGKTLADIIFVSGNGHDIPVDNFIEIAKKYDYDSGYGGTEVPEDLKVVGTDWWLERHEYDGSEWWEFKMLPKRPLEVKSVKAFDRERYGDEIYVY